MRVAAVPVLPLKNGLTLMIDLYGYLAVKNRYSYYTRYCQLIRDSADLKWKVFLHYGKIQQCAPLDRNDIAAALDWIKSFCKEEGAYFIGEITDYVEKRLDVYGGYYFMPFKEEHLQ